VLTRGVGDAALLYDLAIGFSPAPQAGPGWAHSLREAAVAGPGRLHIGVTFELGMRASPAHEVEHALQRLTDALTRLGHHVSEVSVDPGNWLLPFTVLGTNLLVEQARTLEAPKRLERRTRTVLRTGALINDRVLRWATDRQQHVAARADRVFDQVDLVLTPTVTQPPPHATRWSKMGALRTSRSVGRWCPYTSLWNFIGQPAANIPVGFSHTGLPIGAQLLAPPNAEPQLIGIASQIEGELAWTDARPPL
jgi:amidase